MKLVRGVRESLDLIHLFLTEEENGSILKKWFLGEIVDNNIARAAQDKFLNQEATGIGSQIPFKEAQAHIYRLLSLYSHISYSALLDSFDVYNRSFDFQRVAGFYYISTSALPHVQTMLESTLLALKHFYGVIGDQTIYGELDTILRQLSPRIRDIKSEEEIK